MNTSLEDRQHTSFLSQTNQSRWIRNNQAEDPNNVSGVQLMSDISGIGGNTFGKQTGTNVSLDGKRQSIGQRDTVGQRDTIGQRDSTDT